MKAAALSRELAKKIQGRVVLAGGAEFASVVQIDNGRVRLEPPIAAIPASVDDVVAIVKFAREEDMRITTKCGGHSAAGYCLALCWICAYSMI
jgi:FAD/FMN-containing dehydrogenase